MPNLFILAGPNGAGKSTSAPEILVGLRHVAEFVNADVIKKELGGSELQAGRRALQRLDALTEKRSDMAFETTLASRVMLSRIRGMQRLGYRFHLIFFWLPNADIAIKRVAARVAAGGHHIPEDVVRRRYEHGLHNFFNEFAPLADSWVLMDNTRKPSKTIASRGIGGGLQVHDNEVWVSLTRRYMKPRVEEEKQAAYESPAWTAKDIEDAVNRAVTAALRRHKERGESIVQWRDGRIVTIKPEDIDV